MTYNHDEHRHRFSVWAAARAAQRGFTTVEDLREALESTNIRDYICDPASLECSADEYEQRHRVWCNSIVKFLCDKGVPKVVPKVTFGRAAKLVAVYVKSMVVTIPDGRNRLSTVAHPPIDRVLLQNLASSNRIDSEHKRLWRKTTWTKLNELEYYKLIETLRTAKPENEPWWTIEEYWEV